MNPLSALYCETDIVIRKRVLWCLPAVGLVAAVLYPQFRSTAEYGWLAFGPAAKVRVLLSANGNTVSFARHVDGKPDGPRSTFRDLNRCDMNVAGTDGGPSYHITGISEYGVTGAGRHFLVYVNIEGSEPYYQYCDIGLAADPRHAPVAHFDGPLTVQALKIAWRLPPQLALRRGDKPTEVCACVGTLDQDKGCWVVVYVDQRNGKPAFPRGVCPVVDVEFPPKLAGGRALKRRYPLDKFC